MGIFHHVGVRARRIVSLLAVSLLVSAPLNSFARTPPRRSSVALAPTIERLFSTEGKFARRAPFVQQTAKSALPPAQRIPPRNYDTKHIKLDLRFDWEKEQAIGTATITFAPLNRNVSQVDFDARNMTFESVKLQNGAALKFDNDPAHEKLHVTLDRAYQPTDELTIVINYHTNGVVKDKTGLTIADAFGRGLTFIKPTPDDPKRPRQIYSQGESEFNHYWFPCFDHPNDFASSEVIATVEKPFTVISNGSLIETRDNPDGTRTFHWKMDTPHASYLTSIVIGEYAPIEQRYDNIPVITYVYPNEVQEGRVTAARMADMVRYFSEATGVKYAYPKYSQTMVHDFGGGMENISATTMTDTMIHDARAETDETSDSLESHELAHQWFGDYVTCRTWAHIWLNESFATYFQALWDEKSVGRDEFLYSDVIKNQEQYFESWNQGLRRPIVTSHYRNPDDMFDNYAYPYGGAVLHMLRTTLGDDDWWRAINHYLTKYAHQPVETEQLRIAIEEATGKPMDWFFDQWVYRMGHPVLRVTKNYDAGKLTLTVRQEQKVDPSNPFPQTDYFMMPVDVEIGTASGVRVERVMMQPQAEQTFTFAVDSNPQLVKFDYGDTIVKELKFEKTTDELLYQIAKDPDMTGRLFALHNLAEEKLKASDTSSADKERIAQALAASLSSDNFWGVRHDAAEALSGTTNASARQSLVAAAMKDPKSKMRAQAIESLGATKDAQFAGLYKQSLNDQSYLVIRAAAAALGDSKSPDAYNALTRLLDVPSWRDTIRASALRGLNRLADPRSLEVARRYAAPGNPDNVRAPALVLLARVGKTDANSFQTLSDALLSSAKRGDQQLAFAAIQALVEFGDPRAIQTLEEARKNSAFPIPEAFVQQVTQRLQQQKTRNQPTSATNPAHP